MAYCSVDEVLGMIKEDMMSVIIGDDYIEDSDERQRLITPLAAEAIEDADAEINGYLSKRYDVPFARTPRVLNKFSKDIAVYNLASRHGIDEGEREKTYLTRYKSAIDFLKMVADGKIDIGAGDGSGTGAGGSTDTAAQTGFAMQHEPRIFTRTSMEGW